MRAIVVAALVTTGACITPAPYQVTQHGVVAPPRAPTYDGQPLAAAVQLEGHGSLGTEARGEVVASSGAAVTRRNAGVALRKRIGEGDLGLELDADWSRDGRTLGGESSRTTGVPEDAVIGVAVALRRSWVVDGKLRLGVAAAFGGQSHPIRRDTRQTYSHDMSGLLRMAIVPSYRAGDVTFYGSAGFSTEADVPRVFTVVPDSDSSNDPGVVAETTGVAGTLAAGASIRFSERVHLNGQASYVQGIKASYGPQLTVGLAFDLGDAAPPR